MTNTVLSIVSILPASPVAGDSHILSLADVDSYNYFAPIVKFDGTKWNYSFPSEGDWCYVNNMNAFPKSLTLWRYYRTNGWQQTTILSIV